MAHYVVSVHGFVLGFFVDRELASKVAEPFGGEGEVTYSDDPIPNNRELAGLSRDPPECERHAPVLPLFVDPTLDHPVLCVEDLSPPRVPVFSESPAPFSGSSGQVTSVDTGPFGPVSGFHAKVVSDQLDD